MQGLCRRRHGRYEADCAPSGTDECLRHTAQQPQTQQYSSHRMVGKDIHFNCSRVVSPSPTAFLARSNKLGCADSCKHHNVYIGALGSIMLTLLLDMFSGPLLRSTSRSNSRSSATKTEAPRLDHLTWLEKPKVSRVFFKLQWQPNPFQFLKVSLYSYHKA